MLRRDKRKAGDVSAGTRQTCDVASTQGVANGCHHDGYRAGGFSRCLHRLGRVCNDDVDIGLDKLFGQSRQILRLRLRIPKLEYDIAPFDPAELRQPLAECRKAGLPGRIAGRQPLENADFFRPGLRARPERPTRDRGCECDNKLSPRHVAPQSRGQRIAAQNLAVRTTAGYDFSRFCREWLMSENGPKADISSGSGDVC